MKNKNILISGASIAGPALAFWLRRYGFNPTVVERASAMREGGYKIDVRAAALDVLERMGLLSEVQRASTDMQVATFVDRNGEKLASMDAQLFGGRKGEDIELMRGDLVKILHEATRKDVEYIFGDSIASLRQTDSGVQVSFKNGEPRTFDLVIGADGLHSHVRGLVFGDEAQFVHDLGHFISIFTVPNHRQLDRSEMLHATPGKSSGMYSTRQSTDARAMFMFAAPPQMAWDHHDVAQQKKLLAETFAGEGWDVPLLLEAMWDAPDFYFDAISQVRMDRWSSGRVALVGDAAYCPSPASGQGSSLGLVGAYVLAGELAAAAGDHHAAFNGFQNELRHFVEQNQKLAEGNLKGMVMKSAAQLRIQLLVLRLLPYLPGKKRIVGRVADAIQKAASAITLKDYPVAS